MGFQTQKKYGEVRQVMGSQEALKARPMYHVFWSFSRTAEYCDEAESSNLIRERTFWSAGADCMMSFIKTGSSSFTL